MPRLVKIPSCSYEIFAKIRGAYLDHAPWALRNDIYEKETDTAFFFFEDSAYIPVRLHPFIMSPPFDQEQLNTDLINVYEDLKLIKKTLGDTRPDPEMEGNLGDDGKHELELQTEEDTVTSISHSDLIDLLTEESDEQFKESLKDHPPKIREKLLNWRNKQKESKK